MIGPISGADRIDELDVLRGIALLGVLIGNLAEFFFAPMTATADQLAALPTADADGTATFLVQLLVENKANMMFGLLFGIGFALQIDRLRARTENWRAIYTRRLLILLAFGVFELLFFMPFDILHVYALAGLLLMPIRKLSDRVMFFGGLLVVLFGIAVVISVLQASGLREMSDAAALYTDAAILERQAAVQDWSYAYFFDFYLKVTLHENILGGFLFTAVVYALGRFMLGVWIARKGWLFNVAEHKRLFLLTLIVALPAGLAAQAYLLLVNLDGISLFVRLPLQLAATMSIVAGYGSAIVMGMQSQTIRRVLRVAAPVGKMALTNYVLLGVASVALIFGPYGQAGQIGMSHAVIAGFVFFGIAILLSVTWLHYFRYGPLEWCWRALTYGTRPPFRRVDGTVAISRSSAG